MSMLDPSLGERLVRGSLTDESLLRATGRTPDTALLPFAHVLKIGGQSMIDRGRRAVFPLLEELTANLGEHKLIIGTGAGTRARHVYSLGVDLGLPTGVLTTLGTGVALQNARMLGYLLARHGIPVILPVQFSDLPLYLMERSAVLFPGMPPYTFWEHNPAVGLIPPHRTDTGCYLVAEVFGARSMIYVKDEDGLYTDDPRSDPAARLIPRATVDEIEAMRLPTLCIDRSVLALLRTARHCRRLQIVNGTRPGLLPRALDGEHVGTVIEA